MVGGSGAWVTNYLRVRGEYEIIDLERFTNTELPPRARRILPNDAQCGQTFGTTSACAENTQARFSVA